MPRAKKYAFYVTIVKGIVAAVGRPLYDLRRSPTHNSTPQKPLDLSTAIGIFAASA